jgi:hypothetical protein
VPVARIAAAKSEVKRLMSITTADKPAVKKATAKPVAKKNIKVAKVKKV